MDAARAARAGRRENLLASRGARRRERSLNAAFERFYRKHVAAVYQYALAVLTNPADAEDVTQQTFLNAYRAFQRGERPLRPHNWVIKIAHNVCRMRWRQSTRRPQEVPLELVREPVALERDEPSLDEVLAALARLPFNQRAAIVMREVEDRSYAEIADVLETTVPAVEALLFRARTNLRARRKALGGALSVAPVPASLSSFFGGSGGVIAAGGAAVGSELALKVAAIVSAGVVAGGLGFKTVKAVGAGSSEPVVPAAQASQAPLIANPVERLAPSGSHARTSPAGFDHPRVGPAARSSVRRAPAGDRASDGGSAPAVASGGAETAPGSTISGVVSSAPAADTVNRVVASVPTATLPPAPTTSLPVATPTVPSAPLPTAPSLTVTVPTVTVPPPPLN
ncbi:MAG TPA: sigma-70 family RNA polymerase sigma factor [Gaiellaceae bacterium]|nr:sigma-70 family RNA polymerase sigma factor [Gaiellaceae bacterium]